MKLSVVIPLYNERDRIAETIEAAAGEIADAGLEAEIVVVDDGSTDGSGEAAAAASAELPVRVLRQQNAGRWAARKAGLEAALGEFVLFLDSRVRLHPGALAFVSERLREGEDVWNAHVEIEADGNPYGRFWNVLTELVFSEYFANPRTTSFGAENFDRFPKGTTCFLAPREALVAAFGAFSTRYEDPRNANDDTPIIRRLAEERRINISPRFRCLYRPRTSLRGFLRHAQHRGLVFVDGHGRRESGFFPLVVAFYPVSAALAFAALRRPVAVPALAAVAAVTAGTVAATRGRVRDETLAFAVLAPVYAIAHGVGMWRGLAMLAAQRLRGG
jgi:glycosyltransferase involved in cell wall biosynthesis